MKHTKQFLLMTAIFLCSLTAKAYHYSAGGMSYNDASTTSRLQCILMKGINTSVVKIPSAISVKGYSYTVISVGAGAFRDYKSLVSVTFPGWMPIEGSAFSGCSNLTTIDRPGGSIGDNAFRDCSSLTSIGLLSGPIGDNAFSGCSSLTSIELGSGSIGDNAFSDCSSLTSITIPKGISSIGHSAFSGCSNLVSIIVEDGNTKYDSRNNCNAIIETSSNTLISGCSSTIIPEGITTIEKNAFNGCCNLTSITIPKSVTSIGEGAFGGCVNLTSIIIPKSVTSIGEGAFEGCSNLVSIIVEEGNTKYDSRNNCNAIILKNTNCLVVGCSSTIIPESVTSIGSSAFRKCSSLTTITIPESVSSIGSSAFCNCSSLTSINIPPSVTSIGNSAFRNCGSLTSINIPEAVTSIEYYAFDGCCSLTSITIPESVTEIGYCAFADCRSLTSITIPKNVTEIGDWAFDGCHNLERIKFDCTTVKGYWFSETTIKEVVFGNGVNSIESGAFNDCTSLREVIFENGSEILSLGRNGSYEGLFYDCPLEKLYLGRNLSYDTSYSSNYSPFYHNDIKSLTIGSGITSIESKLLKNYPTKAIWLTNTPPTGYQYIGGQGVNFVANNQYTGLNNTLIYPNLSSMFDVDGVKYVPISLSERTCSAIDYSTNNTNTGIDIHETVSFKGIAFVVEDVLPYAFYGSDRIKELTVSHNGDIGDYAFTDCINIQNARLANQGSVGKGAFYGCSFLEDIVIGDQVTTLYDEAFRECERIEEVNIPSSVSYIGEGCFRGCNSLEIMTVSENNTRYDSRDNCNAIIESENNKLIGGCNTTIIPEDIKSIGNYGFSDCKKLAEVIIPHSISTIGASAFEGCSSLLEFIIPNSVTTIGNNVVAGCSKLSDVIISDRTEPLNLGSNGSSSLFADCPLDSVYIGGKITYSTTSSKGYSPFYRNTSLRTVVITDREEQIYANEFYGCTNLQSVTIGNGVKSIGNYAFSGCSSLEGFSFGNSMESVGDEAFSDCTNLTSLTSYAAVPPTCGSQALDDINKWNCTLYIPTGSLAAYMAADQWKEFFFIEDNVTDGIEDIIMNDKQTEIIYDLQGRRVLNTDNLKGIYIINGKKTIK